MKLTILRLGISVSVLLWTGAAAAQPYVISTVAGGLPPVTPLPAPSASVNPFSIAADGAGNVYFTSDFLVYKVDSGGMLTRVTGGPYYGLSGDGLSGDGGPAVNARLQLTVRTGVAADKAGNLYIADKDRIRKVSPDGLIRTVAGGGGFSQRDGAQATDVSFSGPLNVAVDDAGNFYISDARPARIWRVTPDGIIKAVAGNGLPGYTGDGGPATQASLTAFTLTGLSIDGSGNIYFIAENGLRKVGADGIITTIGGQFTNAQDLAADRAGNVYVADFYYVRKISPNGATTNLMGAGAPGTPVDGAPAAGSRLNAADGIAVDNNGNVYVADFGSHRVYQIAADGIVRTIAGNGVARFSGDGGPAMYAQFNSPMDLALDSSGSLYVADYENYRVRRITPDGNIRTLAGDGGTGSTRDGTPAANAHLGRPAGVVVDRAGNVFLSDSDNACVWKVATSGLISRVAGGASSHFSGDGGPATQAGLFVPWGLALDSTGNLYIADQQENRIRKVSTNGTISTVAGNGVGTFSGDGGKATSAGLNHPVAVAVDSAGNLYISDAFNFRVRRVSANGTITTFAGTGTFGTAGDDGPATAAQVSPKGLAFDQSGSLYIADGSSIRVVSSDGIIRKIAGGPPFAVADGWPALGARMTPRALAIGSQGAIYELDGTPSVRVLQTAGPLAVQNAASNATGAISPGEIITLYGSNLGPDSVAVGAPGGDGVYATEVAETRVTVNGLAAPIIYASATQTAAIVPFGVTGTSAGVTVSYRRRPVATLSAAIAASAPGIFTLDSTGTGQAAAVNADGSINGAANPAKAGDVILLFATGQGQTTPIGVDGQIASEPLPRPVLPVKLSIGGRNVEVQYAGGAPGEVAGVMQINAVLPAGVASGNLAVILQVGGASSQAGVTVAVR